MTPRPLAFDLVSTIDLDGSDRILEPSCGDGVFLSAIVQQLTERRSHKRKKRQTELIGVEIDPVLAARSRAVVEDRDLHALRDIHAEVYQEDFFDLYLGRSVSNGERREGAQLSHGSFDLIVGNPPFGGTFDRTTEDLLDRVLGRRLGMKIKKETYAFFIVACLDLLRYEGRLVFICSDTLLTIPTMTGLRRLLMEYGEVSIRDIHGFSKETSYPTVVLDFVKGGPRRRVTRNAVVLDEKTVYCVPNLSWGVTPEFAGLFDGPLLQDCFVATSGMTTGKNEYFVREVDEKQKIVEPYSFEFYDGAVTVQYEMERARLGKLPRKRLSRLEQAEARGAVERRMRVVPLSKPLTIQMPDDRYRPYNKANNRLMFSEPTHYIMWEDEGDAVLTYKRTGNWYLRGVGGQPYFGREGITWQLVAGRFIARYLPAGYILDSGAPCAFAREGVPKAELLFVLGWLLSGLANRVLKTVINHTRNIQSKDFERMPYPWWVTREARAEIVGSVEAMISEARGGRIWSAKDAEIRGLDELFEFRGDATERARKVGRGERRVFGAEDEFVLTAG